MKGMYGLWAVFLLLCVSLNVSSQTFKIVEYELNDVGKEKLRDKQKKYIGTDLILEIEQNAVHIKSEADGGPATVFRKQANNIYTFKEDNLKAEIVLDYNKGYLIGGSTKMYVDGKQIGKVVFKKSEKVTVPFASIENPETKMLNADQIRQEKKTKSEIFVAVEQQAVFPGGMPSLMNWISENIKYPEEALQNGNQGRVIVKLVIDADGSVVDATIVKGVCESLDQEALRLAKIMPKWQPAKNNGKDVASYFTLPFNFRLP